MATVNKDFKIKHGLVVEGTTGTINGANILTESEAGDDYILGLVGGSGTPDNTPDTIVQRDSSGNFAAGTITADGLTLDGAGSISNYLDEGDIRIQTNEGSDFDVYADDLYFSAADDFRVEANDLILLGSTTGVIHLEAADAYFGDREDPADRIATEGYVTDAIGDIDLTFNSDEITEGTTNLYFTNQRALDATSTAYDAAGAAATAESNANSYTDTELADYTLTSDLDTTVGGYGYLKSADLGDYATETYVNDAVDALVDGAPGLLDTLNEIAAAINDDENYATTMTTALSGKQNNLTAGDNIDISSDVISVTGLDSTDISDFNTAALSATASAYDAAGAADTAEDNANSYTDGQIGTLDSGYTVRDQINLAVDDANSYTDTEIGNLTTDDIGEGSTNLYYSESLAKTDAAELLTGATLTNITITGDGSGLTITAENGVAGSTTDDLAEGEENLYFTDERAIDAIDGASITPTVVTIDTYRKEEAAHLYVTTASTVNVHSFSPPYESAKYLVRVVGTVGGTRHSQLTEILMTVDGNNNVAITEYGTIYTSENPLASFSASVESLPAGTSYILTATTLVANTEIIAAATMLSWAD